MPTNIYEQIERLLQFGLRKKLFSKYDIDFVRNALLDVLGLEEWESCVVPDEYLDFPISILEEILDWAAENGRIEENSTTYRDLFDTKLMGCLLSRPSEVIRNFYQAYESLGAEAATKKFYQLSQEIHYIRTDRIAKNEHWSVPTEYGDIEITINLSKPEKDPKEIAAERMLKQSSYPECLLCKDNVGYSGRMNHPARQNLRVIPLELSKEQWFFQFSPYVYYNEHAIIFKDKHEPMKISKQTIKRILEFTEKFPHYFLGSNADLPIVGGSILSHDHFQGGSHDFPMAKAEMEMTFQFSQYPNVKAGIIKWPLSVIRLQGLNRYELAELGGYILQQWKMYSDERVDIQAFTGDIPHNTITPIARRNGSLYELDLVLRNNRTNEEYPLGIFHPHQEVHHIKKENIGLIEVMGLAVLPGRLQEELKTLADSLVKNESYEKMKQNQTIIKHLTWATSIKEKYPELNSENVSEIFKQEVGLTFTTVLEHAGVFKRDRTGIRAFKEFMNFVSRKI
ncbi:UDP-glucose--hexose-1-phosphate uridylyltransferase [Neobacillus ginsengisoli]|nr:UDP-glucose--hexose-1-phosphate uridylyltransferase [Neobacillus ginsengisoli]